MSEMFCSQGNFASEGLRFDFDLYPDSSYFGQISDGGMDAFDDWGFPFLQFNNSNVNTSVVARESYYFTILNEDIPGWNIFNSSSDCDETPQLIIQLP